LVRNLILAGGPSHPVAETGDPLVAILRDAGMESEVTRDVETGLARLARGEFERLTVVCLRWTMMQLERFAPLRAEWALSLSAAGRSAIRDYVASGRGLLALHGAPISFDDWPEWAYLLGVAWRWGVSHHPPCAPAELRPAAEHPITAGMQAFTVRDEIYSALEVEPWMQPLAEARHAGIEEWRPVVFAGEQDGCRRAYCGFGHDAASLSHPAYRALVARAARWVARETA
jgi:type 1 glutamine amidotransferase